MLPGNGLQRRIEEVHRLHDMIRKATGTLESHGKAMDRAARTMTPEIKRLSRAYADIQKGMPPTARLAALGESISTLQLQQELTANCLKRQSVLRDQCARSLDAIRSAFLPFWNETRRGGS